MGAGHQVHERQVIQRFDKVDVAHIRQQPVDRLAHVGVEVHRVYHVQLGELPRSLHQGLADALEAATKVLAPVAGDQQQPAFGCQVAELAGETGLERGVLQLLLHLQQGVDHGIAGGENVRRVGAFAQQVVARGGGGRKVQCGKGPGQAPVAFFGPG